jgi:hypothetical protein
MNGLVNGLVGAGLEQALAQGIIDELRNAVLAGESYSELAKRLQAIQTTPTNAGLLTKHSKTYAHDAINDFMGQRNKIIGEDLRLEWYMYVGSNLITTREFCKHLTKKKYIHESEIPDILAGKIDGHQCEIYSKTHLPYGMIAGTNTSNFSIYRGGWNCGHQLVPVAPEAVPADVRAKIEREQILPPVPPLHPAANPEPDNKHVYRTEGGNNNKSVYKRVNSPEAIIAKLKELDKGTVRNIEILQRKSGRMAETDGRGNVRIEKDQYEAFNNAIDKLLQSKANEMTALEAQATLIYWHERIHNLPIASLQSAKMNEKQEKEMELATEFVAQKTLPEFYKMFGAKMPEKINLSSGYAAMTRNYQTAVNKLSQLGGINENDVVEKLKQHIINGAWENQKTGLVNALYGAKINGKIISRGKLGKIVDAAIGCHYFQFERRMNKILGIN